MREVIGHFDGQGSNESIRIEADDLGPGEASSFYRVLVKDQPVATIQFQKGPRYASDSILGITEEALLAIIADRMDPFSAGRFSCRENLFVLTKCEEALHWLRRRAENQDRRRILGDRNLNAYSV